VSIGGARRSDAGHGRSAIGKVSGRRSGEDMPEWIASGGDLPGKARSRRTFRGHRGAGWHRPVKAGVYGTPARTKKTRVKGVVTDA